MKIRAKKPAPRPVGRLMTDRQIRAIKRKYGWLMRLARRCGRRARRDFLGRIAVNGKPLEDE